MSRTQHLPRRRLQAFLLAMTVAITGVAAVAAASAASAASIDTTAPVSWNSSFSSTRRDATFQSHTVAHSRGQPDVRAHATTAPPASVA